MLLSLPFALALALAMSAVSPDPNSPARLSRPSIEAEHNGVATASGGDSAGRRLCARTSTGPNGTIPVPPPPPAPRLATQDARESAREAAAAAAERTRNDPAALCALLDHVRAADDHFDLLNIDRDSEIPPTAEDIAEALEALKATLLPLPEWVTEYDPEVILEKLDRASADLVDEESIDAYTTKLNDDEEAAAPATFRPFQASIAEVIGFSVTVADDGRTSQLTPDLEAIAARSGKFCVLHSAKGGLGKSFLMKQIEDAIERVTKTEGGGRLGTEGAKIGCVKISSLADLSDITNVIFRKFLRQDKDEKGKVISSTFDPPPYVYLLVDLSRAFSESMTTEAKFFGTFETLLGNCATYKYEGGEVAWIYPPIFFIVSNGRPIEVKVDKHTGKVLRDPRTGKIGYNPKCHLSAYRLAQNVFTVKTDKAGNMVLLQV